MTAWAVGWGEGTAPEWVAVMAEEWARVTAEALAKEWEME